VVVPDRPVFLPNRDHHGAWANTAALRLAGITAATSDPPDGRIEREPDGGPQGTLHEGAVDLVARHLPDPDDDDLLAALLRGQEHLHSLGVTGWQDAIVGAYGTSPDPLPAYLRAAESGQLTARVVGALWWDRTRGLEQLPDLVARRAGAGGAAGTGRFRATAVKIMQDGVAENFTAGMLAPYLDGCGCRTANQGLSYLAPDLLDAAVRALDAEGFQVHLTPSATAPSARRWTPSSAPGRPTGRTTCGTTSPTCRWCTPTTSRASPSWGSPPTCRRCGRSTSPRWTT
jgi:predicted amidohydrolase YtcJ